MPRVLAFGTFDLFHPGHEFFLAQAAALGELHVAVARDAHVLALKGRAPQRGEAQRLATVRRVPNVAEARLSDETLGSYAVVDAVRPDVIALGFDQAGLAADLARWMEETGRPVRVAVMRAKA